MMCFRFRRTQQTGRVRCAVVDVVVVGGGGGGVGCVGSRLE